MHYRNISLKEKKKITKSNTQDDIILIKLQNKKSKKYILLRAYMCDESYSLKSSEVINAVFLEETQ